MTPPFVPREQVAERLAIPPQILARYEARGLVHTIRVGDVVGYELHEVRRLWSIVSLQRDLGVNLAGVEAILRLRAHVGELHRQLAALARELESALDVENDDGSDAR